MANKKPVVVVGGNISELPSADTLTPNNASVAGSLIIPVEVAQSGAGNIVYDPVAETVSVDFGSGLIIIGSVGTEFFAAPVANFAALPLTDSTGTMRITLDNSQAYIWDGTNWVSADNFIHKPATEADITGAVITGSTIGEVIMSNDTFRLYVWSGAAWQLTSSTFLVKDETGTEITGLFDILSSNNTITTTYINGTGLPFDLSAAGITTIHSVDANVFLSAGYDQNIYSITTNPIINGTTVNVKITIGYDDTSQGLLINEELDILLNPPFDGSFINQVIIRALVS